MRTNTPPTPAQLAQLQAKLQALQAKLPSKALQARRAKAAAAMAAASSNAAAARAKLLTAKLAYLHLLLPAPQPAHQQTIALPNGKAIPVPGPAPYNR